MKNLFVPYELALQLKGKGFKENCLGFYSSSANAGDNNFSQHWFARALDQDKHNPDWVEFSDLTNDKSCLAPLYQQAIDWFDSKNILIFISPYESGIDGGSEITFNWDIMHKETMEQLATDHSTYDTRTQALTVAIKEALTLI